MTTVNAEKLQTPFELLGGEEPILALAERFYDVMERDEPALARLHEHDEEGHVSRRSRDNFALFLVGWLGGRQTYTEKFGHPRLRMRHAQVVVDIAMRDAWVRAMSTAMDECGIDGPVRAFLDQRFAAVADFLRNVEG